MDRKVFLLSFSVHILVVIFIFLSFQAEFSPQRNFGLQETRYIRPKIVSSLSYLGDESGSSSVNKVNEGRNSQLMSESTDTKGDISLNDNKRKIVKKLLNRPKKIQKRKGKRIKRHIKEIKKTEKTANSHLKNHKTNQIIKVKEKKAPILKKNTNNLISKYISQAIDKDEKKIDKDIEKKLISTIGNQLNQSISSINRSNDLNMYLSKIHDRVYSQVLNPVKFSSKLYATVEVTQDETGKVKEVRVIKSSGDPVYDNQIVDAVHRSSPLPLPQNKDVFQSKILLKFSSR